MIKNENMFWQWDEEIPSVVCETIIKRGLQLEKADIDQDEPREYQSTNGNAGEINVFLIPESPNWGWKSIKMLDNGDGYLHMALYSGRPA